MNKFNLMNVSNGPKNYEKEKNTFKDAVLTQYDAHGIKEDNICTCSGCTEPADKSNNDLIEPIFFFKHQEGIVSGAIQDQKWIDQLSYNQCYKAINNIESSASESFLSNILYVSMEIIRYIYQNTGVDLTPIVQNPITGYKATSLVNMMTDIYSARKDPTIINNLNVINSRYAILSYTNQLMTSMLKNLHMQGFAINSEFNKYMNACNLYCNTLRNYLDVYIYEFVDNLLNCNDKIFETVLQLKGRAKEDRNTSYYEEDDEF